MMKKPIKSRERLINSLSDILSGKKLKIADKVSSAEKENF